MNIVEKELINKCFFTKVADIYYVSPVEKDWLYKPKNIELRWKTDKQLKKLIKNIYLPKTRTIVIDRKPKIYKKNGYYYTQFKIYRPYSNDPAFFNLPYLNKKIRKLSERISKILLSPLKRPCPSELLLEKFKWLKIEAVKDLQKT